MEYERRVVKVCGEDREVYVNVREHGRYVYEIWCDGKLVKRGVKGSKEKAVVSDGKEYKYIYVRIHIPFCSKFRKVTGELREYYDVLVRVYKIE